MLYRLVSLLEEFDIPGLGLFGYLSFRAIISFTLALLISIFAGKKIIDLLQKKQIGETIRDLGLEGQMQKKGTPTMGGIIIFISVIIPVILFADLGNIYTILLLISTVWFFLIGFTDDYDLWNSAEDNGYPYYLPYGNFVVDTDGDKLWAFVLRNGEEQTRFLSFDLPEIGDGIYSETYGCNLVTLESTDIIEMFDTEHLVVIR